MPAQTVESKRDKNHRLPLNYVTFVVLVPQGWSWGGLNTEAVWLYQEGGLGVERCTAGLQAWRAGSAEMVCEGWRFGGLALDDCNCRAGRL